MSGYFPKGHKDRFYAKPIAMEYTYYLDDEVSDDSDYHTLYEILNAATENDTVKIVVSNYGGSLSTCISIVNAIRACAGTTVGVLSSVAYSAAGAIFLACNHYEVRNHVGFMAHDAQGVDVGSLSKRQAHMQHTKNLLTSLYNDVYKDFLTEEEITDIVENDRDVWLTEQEITERLQARVDKMEEAATEAMEEMLEPMFEREDLEKLKKAELIEIMMCEDEDEFDELLANIKK